MTRVLVITGDPIGPKMAGPAIRAWNMAQLLAIDNEVALMTTTRLEPVEASFEVHRVKPGEDAAFARLVAWADVIVFQTRPDRRGNDLAWLRNDVAEADRFVLLALGQVRVVATSEFTE